MKARRIVNGKPHLSPKKPKPNILNCKIEQNYAYKKKEKEREQIASDTVCKINCNENKTVMDLNELMTSTTALLHKLQITRLLLLLLKNVHGDTKKKKK